MKNLIFFLLLLLLFACGEQPDKKADNKKEVRIIRENELILSEFPESIIEDAYQQLTDSFNLEGIYSPNIYLGALTPKFPLAYAVHQPGDGLSLFYNGCKLAEGISLLVKDSTGYHNLRTQEELSKLFAPIETKEEALCYALLITGFEPRYDFHLKPEYRIFVNSIPSTGVIEKEKGYEVNIFTYILCGCGPHSHVMVNYFVGIDGSFSMLNSAKIYEDPEEDGLCVD